MKRLMVVFGMALLLISGAAFSGAFFRGGFTADCELPMVDAVCPFSLWVTSRPGALALNMSVAIASLLVSLACFVVALFLSGRRKVVNDDITRQVR